MMLRIVFIMTERPIVLPVILLSARVMLRPVPIRYVLLSSKKKADPNKVEMDLFLKVFRCNDFIVAAFLCLRVCYFSVFFVLQPSAVFLTK